MASLTQTAIITRRFIRYAFFGVIFLIVGKFSLDILIAIYRKINPPAAPAPTVAFGKLPALDFPNSENPQLNLTLETPSGDFPVLSEQMKVYLMPKPTANLLSLDTAKNKVSRLGYAPNGEQLSDTTYRFTGQRSLATLDMNIITGVFSISFDLSQDSSPLETKPAAPEISAEEARSFLNSADLLADDLTDRFEHEFQKIKEGRLVEAPSLSESDLIKIDLFRNDIEEYPAVTTNPKKANIWFLMGGNRQSDKQIVAAEYHYFPVDYTQVSTYPTKSAEEAWNEMLSGKAFIANAGSGTNVVIRRIYLAYYDSGEIMDFLQPVIVFEGDNDFAAYVPAVTSEYYSE